MASSKQRVDPFRRPPLGLAFDSSGNLYAVMNGNQTIEKFTPGGVGSVFATSRLSDGRFIAIGAAAVPEPATYAAFAGLSAFGFAVLRRRRLIKA